MIPFWINEPTILFDKNNVFELWPSKDMCYEQKLNAITRLIILITVLGYVFTQSIRVLVVGLITIVSIFVYFKISHPKKEGFTQENEKVIATKSSLKAALRSEFKDINKKNPFSNVLLTEIMDDPDRKAAPPSFNPHVEENITKNVKKSVQFMNPEIKNSNKQLYGDLWEQFNLDQSNRSFYSTANTRVTNDQGAFSQFLYGNMPSGKSSGPDGDFARVQDNYRYTLY